ncbi:MAG: DHH family phosphoesterase [Oscillospiraceae bacterium]|nr:DHH family phosphoesterase [Oscillospiraceae bacterium]
MNKGSKKIEEPGGRFYILVLLIFAAVTYVLFDQLYLALAEAAAAVVLLFVSTAISRRRHRELVKYIKSVAYETEAAKDNTMMNFPLPMATFMMDSGRMVWGNQAFFSICGRKEPSFDVSIQTLVPEFQDKWILEGKTRCPGLVELNGRRFQVHGNLIRGQSDQQVSGSMGITYWVDVTDYDDIRREYAASRPVVILIMLDNFDEMMKNATDRVRTELRNQIEDRLTQWLEGTRGLFRRYDRDRYIYICERRYFDKLEQEKFTIVDGVHSVVNSSGIHATVSIGVGLEGASYEENFNFASMSVEMALSRGGDQTVIKNRMNFEFYGGRASEVETRTKVKSRVVANALCSFIKDASTTYVMGHSYPDMDALGAAVGVCCIARNYGKRVRIIMGNGPTACSAMINVLKKQKEYEDIFITPKEAMLQANSRSLLVVVDTSRPEQVEDEAILRTISRLVVIDHHRRAASYIENAALTFHEPYASSVCELLVELLQELVEPTAILRFEAEALLAGSVTDTKNFTMRTGERTFDAAAFLRRTGADPISVKRLLQNDIDSMTDRYQILESARIYKGNICIAVASHVVDRVVASQAADEMLNISGVEASVVLYPAPTGGVMLSARSIGAMNVQVLLEKLGGGGNQSAAGAQMTGVTVEEAEARLKTAIDEYLTS